MKDRIRELMEAQHMNQKTFANFTGINSASLSSIFTGRTSPTLNMVEAIMRKFPDVNIEWLMKGTGGMFNTDNGHTTSHSYTPSSSEKNQEQIPSTAQTIFSSLQNSEELTQEEKLQPRNSAGVQNARTANMAAEPNLFDTRTASVTPQVQSVQTIQNVQPVQAAQPIPNNIGGQIVIGQIPQPTLPQRKITEIRVFYDDQTWEEFVPKRQNEKNNTK